MNDDNDDVGTGDTELDKDNQRIDGEEDLDDMRPLRISLPSVSYVQGGTLSLVKTGEGEIRLFYNDGDVANATMFFDCGGTGLIDPAEDPDLLTQLTNHGGKLDLLVEGCTPGEVELEWTYEFPGDFCPGCTVSDVVKMTVMKVDLDIDSDNDDGYDMPEADKDEDDREMDDPGKIVLVNDDDDDEDGLTDFNDDEISEMGSVPVELFSPVIFKVPADMDTDHASITLSYDASPPFEAPTGALRLWTKRGNVRRNPSPLKKGGDYVAPDRYTASELGLDGSSSCKWYVEGVSKSELPGDKTLDVCLQAGAVVFADSVKLTVADVDIESVCFREETNEEMLDATEMETRQQSTPTSYCLPELPKYWPVDEEMFLHASAVDPELSTGQLKWSWDPPTAGDMEPIYGRDVVFQPNPNEAGAHLRIWVEYLDMTENGETALARVQLYRNNSTWDESSVLTSTPVRLFTLDCPVGIEIKAPLEGNVDACVITQDDPENALVVSLQETQSGLYRNTQTGTGPLLADEFVEGGNQVVVHGENANIKALLTSDGEDFFEVFDEEQADAAEVASIDATTTEDAKEFFEAMTAGGTDGHHWIAVANYNYSDDPTDDNCVMLGRDVDLLYIAGHGYFYHPAIGGESSSDPMGDVLEPTPETFQPEDIGEAWDGELEWVCFASCSQVGLKIPGVVEHRTDNGRDWIGLPRKKWTSNYAASDCTRVCNSLYWTGLR